MDNWIEGAKRASCRILLIQALSSGREREDFKSKRVDKCVNMIGAWKPISEERFLLAPSIRDDFMWRIGHKGLTLPRGVGHGLHERLGEAIVCTAS
jgi:hypothetical protein